MSEDCDIVEFGPFRLDTARRLLIRDGQSVPLSSRAFDILLLLVEHRDRVMTKDEILTRVWRGIVVEENNLAVQVSALRRALGESELDAPLILTVPGQGYRFVGRVAAAVPAVPEPAVAAPVDVREHPPGAPVVVVSAGRWRMIAGAGALVVAGCAVAFVLLRPAAPPPPAPPPAPPRLSIAVLPFRDLSDDRCCAYLADAVSDDLTTDLSHIPGSVVIARESSDVYRDKSLPTAEIGGALNVRYLLEGSLRAVEGNFSINAQLIEAATGVHLWAEHFSVPRNHLGAAQDAVVHRLASALGVQLIQIEGSAAAREHGNDPDALDLFFQARSIMDRDNTMAGMTRAQVLLQRAVAKQPDFADGLGALAWLLARKVHDGTDPQFRADLDMARQVGATALRVAPNSGFAMAAHGLLLSLDGQWQVARDSLEAALADEPESVPVYSALISCLGRLGDYQAQVDRIEELLRIDPLGPEIAAQYYRLGAANVMLGRPRDGLAWLTRFGAGRPAQVTDADPEGVDDYAWLYRIAALQMIGDTQSAGAEFARYDRIRPNRTAWQISAFFTHAQAALPGAARFTAALIAAGMKTLQQEDADWHVQPTDRVVYHGPFDPTPLSIPGASMIRSDRLASLMAASPVPRIINVGSGAVTLDNTVNACKFDWENADEVRTCAHFLQTTPGGPVVVMGLGVTDWNGYNGALALAHAGVPDILWYRGGEESWHASHGQSHARDTRR